MTEHLLPPNATKWERAVAASFARIQTISVPVQAVRDPALCPAALLPWLAYHHSVDSWSSAWSEATKREVVATSYEVKKSKGTRSGVMRALRAQGFSNVRVETWFEYGGSPYRFRLSLDIDAAAPWTEAEDSRLIGTVLRAKAVRSRLESIAFARPLSPGMTPLAAVLFIEESIELDSDYADLIEFPPPSARIASGIEIIETITTGPLQ